MKKIKTMHKKKLIIIIITSILIILLMIFGIFEYIQYKNEKARLNLITDIKNSYSKYIVLKKDANIYNKKHEEIGHTNQKLFLEITKVKKKDVPFYQIKNTSYYVYYKDVAKTKTKEDNNLYPHYINLNKDVVTKTNAKLYYNTQLVLTLKNSMTLPIKFIDDDVYYVEYLNKIFALKNEDVVKVTDTATNTNPEADYISIINYNKIATTCESDDCVSLATIEEELNYLTSDGFYGINFKEYKNWLKSNIRLQPKAILLMTSTETDEVKQLNEKYQNIINIGNASDDIKFLDNNNKTTKDSNLTSLSRYNVKLNTKLDTFKKMVLGENVPIEVKKETNNQKIAVINYHFFYDATSEICNENICLDIQNFRQELDYLKANNYKTLTIEEFRAWMYNEIELPTNSVLLTIDDGALGTGTHNGNKLIPILEEYNMHATLFLITGWWDINNYRSPNLDIESHTYDMHNTGPCGKAQMICANHDELMNDLQKSISITNSTKAFCFPFYTFDDEAIQAVQESGFKLAFIGGSRKASRLDNKFKIPRYPVHKGTTLEQFINMVS